MRAMVKFDVSSIPADGIIDSATLSLYVNTVDIYELASDNVNVHAITKSWADNTVTWNIFGTAGYNSTVLDSAQFSSLSDGEWVTFTIPKATIQGWLASSSTNYGFMVKRRVDDDPGLLSKWNKADFASSENSTVSLRPKLAITYHRNPEISVDGQGQVIDDGDDVPRPEDNTDFGSVSIDSSKTHIFTIKNTGPGALTLTGDPKVDLSDTINFTVTVQPTSPIAASTGSNTFSVRFNPKSSGELPATIRINNNDTDENPYNFTITGNGVPSGDGFMLSKSSLTVAENGGTDNFTVVLTSRPSTTVKLNIESSATGEATVSPSSVSFNSDNWDTPKPIIVTGVNDDDLGNDSAVITVSVDDAASDDAYDDFVDQTVDVTCTDDDGSGVLTVTIDPASMSENGGVASATVSRDGDTGSPLTVTLVSDTPGEAMVPTSVTILTGEPSADFIIIAVDDLVVDGTATVTITASAALHDDGSDTIDVLDDDVAGLTVAIANATISENGGTTTGTVTRNTETSGPLVVALSSSNTDEATVPSSVTILSGETSETFTITAVDDDLIDGEKSVTITATASEHADGMDSIKITDDEILIRTRKNRSCNLGSPDSSVEAMLPLLALLLLIAGFRLSHAGAGKNH